MPPLVAECCKKEIKRENDGKESKKVKEAKEKKIINNNDDGCYI